MARSAAKSLTALYKDRSLNLQLKCRLTQALVWSMAMYGCESWTITAAYSKRLNAVETDMYKRRIKDANQLEGIQNQQLYIRGVEADMSFLGIS